MKRLTLRELGLSTQAAEQHRVPSPAPRPISAPRSAKVRVFCIAPFHDQNDEWEDPATREAKRARHVQSATHEQSMGRSSNPLHEMALPDDAGALACRDESTRAEWDVLSQYHELFRPQAIRTDLIPPVPADVKRLLLKPSQRSCAHGMTLPAA